MKPQNNPEKELERIKKLSEYENKYYNKNFKFIAGVDECGRGCLAGPVAAAAVILPRDCIIYGINDSKKLSEKKRKLIFKEILEKALSINYETIDVEIIDKINILQASLAAMSKAVQNLSLKPEVALIDGNFTPAINDKTIITESIIKGDNKSISIAAASIVAKVMRDNLMQLYDKDYPEYNFFRNKGYGTKLHYKALKENGPSPLHRYSFNLLGKLF